MLAANYPTKKALKEAIGKEPRLQETSWFGHEYQGDGNYTVVGPSATERKFYAVVTVKDGKIEKVK